ncbi:MAG: cysteine--tRNA ligase [Candidatus Liptonbacteria bacterium]|nr:cysteine--tRNA ligase [Candidatus Liptonbacteria bacterium]
MRQETRNKGQTIRIWNTLTGKKEPLPVRKGKPLRLFVCGPTVYDRTHIGHLRTYIFFDFFAKYLRSCGYAVTYLQNITDIDDKIIRRAKERGEKPLALSARLTKEYLRDMSAFGADAVDTYAAATKFIPEIAGQVERLAAKGAAYKIESDGYYFDVAQFPGYGKLSRRTAAQAEDAVSRIDDSLGKRNKGDFCLWKFSKPGEPVWNSPLGAGRPGWHIEDTAISEHFFGPQYDVHGGGLDLKFPHHEAEIAQQEAASGKVPFVKLWMHTGMLTVRGEKMSKSLGNFITARDFLSNHSPAAFRFLSLSHHYRTPLDYEEKLVRAAEETLEGIRQFLGKLSFVETRTLKKFSKRLSLPAHARAWEAALADDVNTPKALASLFELIRTAYSVIWKLDPRSTRALRDFLISRLALLGIAFSLPKVPANIKEYAGEREVFRKRQQFVQSDALRKKIEALGYMVEDTPAGPFLWPKKRSTK